MEVEHYKNFDIKKMTAFKVGGEICDVYFPKNIEEFCDINCNYKVLGNLSNVIISSLGYDGNIVITSKMDEIQIEGIKVRAQAGVKGPKLSQAVMEKSLSGFEFMIGFPGSIGGEIAMNASANGQCISDNLISATIYSKDKGVFKLQKDKMGFDYRTSVCHRNNYFVLEGEFELTPDKKSTIEKRMADNLEFRRAHQPMLNLPNCGSVFKNPQGFSAGKLLDEAGVKNLSVGGAKVWENHANFIVNSEQKANSKDILNLMVLMKEKVKKRFDIELIPEIIYIGNRDKEEDELCKILYQK